MDVNILKLNGADYPEVLAAIPAPPKIIYWRGKDPKEWLDRPKVAVVGSRKITPYGQVVTARLGRELAAAGVVIISGLAYGVDIAAHRAALDAGGLTVAILPNGLNRIYPAAHANIAQRILQNGTLITEYTAGSDSFKSNFIARNRIVSGLADVLLITEAAINSGSLHTARFALEQGKTVMAVPGNVTSPISEGTNNLIKSGAVPVTSSDDVFFALGLSRQTEAQKHYKGDETGRLVLGFIKDGVNSQEALAASAGLDGPALGSALTMLELQGYIRPAGGGSWVMC